MALSTQQANFMGRLKDEAQQLLDTRDRLQREIALYVGNDFGAGIDDTDLATYEIDGVPIFAHLTQSNLWNCIAAFTAVLTALGADDTGAALDLIKMRG